MSAPRHWKKTRLGRGPGHVLQPPPPPPPRVRHDGTPGLTGRTRLARAARLGALLAAPLLALAAAPAAAQTVSITSTPANGAYYAAGEAITTRIALSGAMHGGNPAIAEMRLDVGGVERRASSTTSLVAGIVQVNFSYTVVAADADPNGISIPANAIDTMGETWLSVGSVVIPLNNAALGDQSAHRVIGVAARISSTSPAALTEANLDAATIAVALDGVTFESGVTTASFELVTTITGVTIDSVSSVSSGDSSATLTLASTADISAAADLAVKVLAAAHSGSVDLTTGAVSVAPVLAAGSGASTDTISVSVEEGSMGGWGVVLSADPGAGCTGGVTIGVTSGDTAAVTVSPATLTFTTANWNTPQTVTATGVQDDNVVDETVTISHMVTATGCAAAYPTGLSIASVRVTVDDDDMGIFSIDSPRVVEGDSGPTTMTFTVTLSPAASVQATVDYAYAMTGSATSGTDHAAIPSGTLTFAPGETSKTITATVNGDTDMEPDEGIGLQLSNPGPSGFALAMGSGRLANGLIVDDDTPTLTIDSPRVAEGNSGTTELVFTVRLEPASTGQVSVTWAAVGGTAINGIDYTIAATSGTLTFAAGETSKTVPVEVLVLGDSEIEPDETARVAIHNPTPSGTPIRNAAGNIHTSAFGVGTIVDDDDRPSPPSSLPSLTIDAPQVVEGPSGTTATLRFTVTMSRTTARQVTVTYEDTGSGTARAGALCERGADYVAFAPGTLTFAPGTRTRTIDVTVIGDAVDEPAELVVVRLRSAVNATLSVSTGVGTITDDDPSARSWSLPLVVAASNPAETGLVRIVNRSGCAGAVAIHAIDDAGRRAGPVALSLDANAAVTFNSRDLEEGNASKGLDGGVGSGGAGPWRLELRTALDVEATAYLRTVDGFLTSVHESAAEEAVAEADAGSSMRHSYRLPFFNPGSNRRLQSRLRLVNPGDGAAEVVVTGRDDAGESPGGEVRLTLAAGESRSLGAAALEAGGDGLEGSLGDGSGKWRLTVTADRPLRVMSLLRNPSGNLTNVSGAGPEPEGGPSESEGEPTEPEGEPPPARTWSLPLVVADADPVRTGLVRIVNRSDRAGAVAIHAIDDAGRRAGPVSLSLGANAAVTFNSHDLEEGNASKGLSDGVGSGGAGPWRLELRTALDVEALAYVRTAEGFLTSVHGSAAEAEAEEDVAEGDVEEEAESMRYTYRVPFFNPGSNRTQQSRLRLVNPGDGAAEVVITGRDDAGESPGSEVRLTLAAGAARSLGADTLEQGDAGFDGGLGDGAGKWRLTVTADRPLRVMSLLRNPTGNLTNVSGAGPEPEVESRP